MNLYPLRPAKYPLQPIAAFELDVICTAPPTSMEEEEAEEEECERDDAVL